MHLKVIFQLLMCGSDAATTPVVCTSALAILPQFDPRMRSLALLEAEIPSPLYVTGKNKVDVFLLLMVAVVAFPLCTDVVEVMVLRVVQFLQKR